MTSKLGRKPRSQFPVSWLRQVAPYFRQHRDKRFVVLFEVSSLDDEDLSFVARDLLLLANIGVRLVLVFGFLPGYPQKSKDGKSMGDNPARLKTSSRDLDILSRCLGSLMLKLEAAFSFENKMDTQTSEMSRVASGNFVTAQLIGVDAGVDLGLTGSIRRLQLEAIESHLDRGEIVLIPSLGHSTDGTLLNLDLGELAVEVAQRTAAEKLILLSERSGILNSDGVLFDQLTLREAESITETANDDLKQWHLLRIAMESCKKFTPRVHIVSYKQDGALLTELFMRDGAGTVLTSSPIDEYRTACPTDIAGILDLIKPMEKQGYLVPRTREDLEDEIEGFLVMVREETVIACGALYPWPAQSTGEIACVAVHPEYRGGNFGDLLLEHLEQRAINEGFTSVFVLTTKAIGWFSEHGYKRANIDSLPKQRLRLYNYSRNAVVMEKKII
jgi:amino-acid N-acetyltransferase